MYYRDNREQLSIEEFFLPFGGRLMKSNRWVCLADIMPWEHIEELYVQNMSEETGRPAIPSRMAFGAVFINAYDHLTDKGAVQSLQENSYMQYFVGLHEFHAEPLFDPSMMVHFRKRFPVEEVAKINEYICTGKWPEEQYRNDEPKAFIPGSGSRNAVSPLAQGPACCDSGGVPPAEDDVLQRHPYLREPDRQSGAASRASDSAGQTSKPHRIRPETAPFRGGWIHLSGADQLEQF